MEMISSVKMKNNLTKASDIVADILVEEGITHAFAISGGASLHLIHSIAANDKIDYICNHNESASAMAADGYSRVSGCSGVTISTSGPGATNLITGICCSYYDSVPTLFITGQVSTQRMRGETGVRQIGFQETPIVDIVQHITKYAVTVTDPTMLRFEIKKALDIARSGRPGPVLIDIPDDLQRCMINLDNMVEYSSEESPKEDSLPDNVEEILDLVRKSERPILIGGWGIHLSKSKELFIKLAESLDIPICLTWGAADVVPSNHPLYVGTFGTHGKRHANFAVQNSDLIISLGSRLDTKSTGSPISTFAREAVKVVVDIDINELEKFSKFDLHIDYLIHSDLKIFIDNIIPAIDKTYKIDRTSWKNTIKNWQKSFDNHDSVSSIKTKKVNPYNFFKDLSSKIQDRSSIFVDTGCSIAWTMQAMESKDSVRIFHDFNNTAMGWAIPASIGGFYANKNKEPLIAIVGDGSFMMTSYELATLSHNNIPLKIFLINNGGYSMIQQTQDQWLDSNYFASSKEGGLSFPDYSSMAKAYGIKYSEIGSDDELKKIQNILSDESCIFCNVKVDSNFRVIPQVKFGRPNEDMDPILPRELFKKNMIVKPLNSK